MRPGSALLIAHALVSTALVLPAAADDAAFFTQKVAPLLKERCVQCHNPKKMRGSLDLSARETMFQGGEHGPAIVAKNAEKSLLIQQVTGPKPRMPKQGEPLSAEQVADVRRWIDSGAVWPQRVVLAPRESGTAERRDWWSLKPLVCPPLPRVKNTAWARSPIDTFIVARLEAKGMNPAAEADRGTLIRRLTFDLHGLPPTPQEIDGFVNDSDVNAYENLVDRLLASPRYGERWGRHWLDVVHYGDTHGYDKDKRRDHAWRYRDYVVRSFNQDKPYGRFIREQVAGDVLYPHTADGIIATGFVAAGPWDFVGHVELREGTVDKLKTRLLDRDDMLSNTISSFLSLTIHCARCHDHKFDPITQKDYYRLQAVFAGVDRGNRPFGNPELVKLAPMVDQRRRALLNERDQLLKASSGKGSSELSRLDAELRALRERLSRLPQASGAASPSNGYHSAIMPGPSADKWVQVDLGREVTIASIRLVPARPTDFPDTPGFGFPARFRVDVASEPTFARCETVADHSKADFPNPGDVAVDLPVKDLKGRYVRVTAQKLWQRTNDYVFALAELQVEGQGKNLSRGASVTALDSIEAGRWSTKYLVDQFDSRRRLPDDLDAKSTAMEKQRAELAAQILHKEQARQAAADALIDAATRARLRKLTQELAEVEKQQKSLSAADQVYALTPLPPRPIHVLHRGDVEQIRELAYPGAIACIAGLDYEFRLPHADLEGTRRAALAGWIADSRNPLTWRSIVNRVWHYHFGRGLVDTPNDVGRNGALPSHPELLDWLATEFRDGERSLKRLHRLIVCSAVYRQTSRPADDFSKTDADNRLLWRMNRQRLDAEATRDAVLAISGKLNDAMGGPGFELFRFKDDHSPVYDHTALEKIHDPATYRRTAYRFVVRSVPNPFLECLDCADPNINTPVRNTTLTALQALALLNDPFMIRQGEYFAERLRALSGKPRGQVELAFRLALGRTPKPEESDLLVAYANKHGLANACRLLLNASEFVFID